MIFFIALGGIVVIAMIIALVTFVKNMKEAPQEISTPLQKQTDQTKIEGLKNEELLYVKGRRSTGLAVEVREEQLLSEGAVFRARLNAAQEAQRRGLSLETYLVLELENNRHLNEMERKRLDAVLDQQRRETANRLERERESHKQILALQKKEVEYLLQREHERLSGEQKLELKRMGEKLDLALRELVSGFEARLQRLLTTTESELQDIKLTMVKKEARVSRENERKYNEDRLKISKKAKEVNKPPRR